MTAVLIFIIILGVLVFVHEVGHFVTARRNGIKADEFGFGFPPRALGIQFMYENGVRKKWRLIWGIRDGDHKNEKEDKEDAHAKKLTGGTIYSLNWVPLGGFVKIKGEDGSGKKEEDSFASKSAWKRIKVLAAGVMMNFALAWVLISIVFMLGAPQAVDSTQQAGQETKIQISEVAAGTPAETGGLKIGDEIAKTQKDASGETISLTSVQDFQDFIKANAGEELALDIIRGEEKLTLKITPRASYPDGQGPLGVSLAQTAIVQYPWYQAIWEGLRTTFDLIIAIVVALGGIIRNLIMGNGVGADVAGPVGIAVLTKEVAGLGLIYILQFTALLSINLGIINILPIPALDGGRILFILIEKIKGRPVSQKVEQAFHSIGFALLILLLVIITFKDVWKFIK